MRRNSSHNSNISKLHFQTQQSPFKLPPVFNFFDDSFLEATLLGLGLIVLKSNTKTNLILKLFLRFLVNMQYAFQDRENLYLIIDIMPGGDLRYHFAKHRKFTEE